MKLDSKLYLHDSDKTAMAALKAIPGFSQVMKAFMKIWNEQQFKIINMSTNLRLGHNQMAKYYDMLSPICEKLGIEVPELYVKLDVNPNAYTYGDSNPFIVVTSGLFETVPDELIPTVLAHECGHIACHHTLYTTMGSVILSGASNFISGLGSIALYPIQLAFAYWMRCSEFSADRAAMICDGCADNTIEMCMRFAGWDKDIMADANVDLFMEQAKEYREFVNNSAWNKTLEFVLFQNNNHPINAVRAYEAREWEKCERFCNILDYLNSDGDSEEMKLPVELAPKKYVGKVVEDVETKLLGMGFVNIKKIRKTESTHKVKSGSVLTVSINDDEECKEDWYKKDSQIVLEYYEPKTEEEIALEHPGEIKMESNYKSFLGRNYEEVKAELENVGFSNIAVKEMALPKFGKRGKENSVAKIIIENQSQFEKSIWFRPESEVVLYYYVSVE